MAHAPNIGARPRKVNFAPEAKLEATSAPERIPPSIISVTVSLYFFASSASGLMVDCPESNCLPPWFDTIKPSTPSLIAISASSGLTIPLMTRLPFHCARMALILSSVNRPEKVLFINRPRCCMLRPSGI